jgi:ATP-binding protein involved in chromosome partitioning
MNDLIAALSDLTDPSGAPVSRRIAAPRLTDGVASLVLDATGLSIAARQMLEDKVRELLSPLPGVSEVRIAVTAEKPQRTLIAVGSGKGGVGKSTVSANLAIALARTGRKVGLVDADIYGPSQPRLLGNDTRPDAVGKTIIPVEAQGIAMLSIGQLVDKDSALAWRGAMATKALTQLLEGDWGDTEILVIDLPPGTGDVQLSLMQNWKPAGAVIVSTPQDLALIDAARAIDLFRKMDVPVLGLIENMAGYACPHCGETSDPFGSGGAEAEAARLGIPFLGRVPLTRAIREASDAGQPPAASDGPEGKPFHDIAARLIERLN